MKVSLPFLIWLSCLPLLTSAQIRTDTTSTLESLVKEVFLGNIKRVDAIAYRGANRSIGLFSCDDPRFPISKGIILSTGDITHVAGPNRGNISTANDTDGYPYLSKLSAGDTYDAAILEFTFFPEADRISFEYIFASEEYREYVDKGFNDVFAFVLTDLTTRQEANLAFLPSGERIHVDNINHLRNTQYYIDNAEGDLHELIEFDGFTTVLKAETQVVPHRPYRITIAIADVYDRIIDSGVILKANSFNSFPSDMAEEAAALRKSPPPQEETFLFDFDAYDLNARTRQKLDSFYQTLVSPIALVQITGHTDSLGSYAYNEKLSANRVIAIADYLVKLGIPKNKIRLRRYGETQPVADNGRDKGRQKNRRVHVVVR